MTGKDFAKEAADRLNKLGDGYEADDYGEFPVVTALADTLAELAAIKADMADVHIKLSAPYGLDRLPGRCRELIWEAHDIAAKHRAETDPLVEAIEASMKGAGVQDPVRWETVIMATSLRAELAKRGIELAQGGAL